jgi:hypothetical protein
MLDGWQEDFVFGFITMFAGLGRACNATYLIARYGCIHWNKSTNEYKNATTKPAIKKECHPGLRIDKSPLPGKKLQLGVFDAVWIAGQACNDSYLQAKTVGGLVQSNSPVLSAGRIQVVFSQKLFIKVGQDDPDNPN